jgi:hypothetical protein
LRRSVPSNCRPGFRIGLRLVAPWPRWPLVLATPHPLSRPRLIAHCGKAIRRGSPRPLSQRPRQDSPLSCLRSRPPCCGRLTPPRGVPWRVQRKISRDLEVGEHPRPGCAFMCACHPRPVWQTSNPRWQPPARRGGKSTSPTTSRQIPGPASKTRPHQNRLAAQPMPQAHMPERLRHCGSAFSSRVSPGAFAAPHATYCIREHYFAKEQHGLFKA